MIRGNANVAVEKAAGGQVQICSFVKDAHYEQVHRIVILSSLGEPPPRNSGSCGVDAHGSGSAILPVSTLEAGACSVAVFPAEDSGVVLQQYYFQVR